MMNSPNATGQTAIRVLGGDVVGSLQHTPSMDSMRAPALTSPMNFSATSSVSQPPRWMPKERRRRDQRGDHASAERLDEAFERPLPPIRLRPLFWIGEWTTRQGAGERQRTDQHACAGSDQERSGAGQVAHTGLIRWWTAPARVSDQVGTVRVRNTSGARTSGQPRGAP